MRFLSGAGYVSPCPGLPRPRPSDDRILAKTGVAECVDIALRAYGQIGEPAIVIGHSFGGFVAQKVAAARNCLALVMLASVPPGVLWPQLRSTPHLFPVLPAILAGRPFRPSAATMHAVPLNTSPRGGAGRALIPRLVRDSGRVFRAMSLGLPIMHIDPADVTVPAVLRASAGADRNVAPWMSAGLRRDTAPSTMSIPACRTGSSPNRHCRRSVRRRWRGWTGWWVVRETRRDCPGRVAPQRDPVSQCRKQCP